jgi:hypothetical protein
LGPTVTRESNRNKPAWATTERTIGGRRMHPASTAASSQALPGPSELS